MVLCSVRMVSKRVCPQFQHVPGPGSDGATDAAAGIDSCAAFVMAASASLPAPSLKTSAWHLALLARSESCLPVGAKSGGGASRAAILSQITCSLG